MTYNEIIYDIMEVISQNQISDDIDIDERQIIYNFNRQRELWINNEYDKPGRQIDPVLIQSLGCVSLVLVDESECCNIDTGCKILRTSKEIPKPIVFKDGIELRVGSPKLTNVPFSVKNINQMPYLMYNKYTKNMMYAFYHNNYLYFKSNDNMYNMLDTVKIWGVFADPDKAQSFEDCNQTNCFSYDDEYPIKGKLYPYIKGEVLKQFGIKQIKDEENNSKD